jgi:hypothetical protein
VLGIVDVTQPVADVDANREIDRALVASDRAVDDGDVALPEPSAAAARGCGPTPGLGRQRSELGVEQASGLFPWRQSFAGQVAVCLTLQPALISVLAVNWLRVARIVHRG